MKQLIEYLLTSLVDRPEDVKVEESISDQTFSYKLNVAPTDLGKVIGKKGRTIKAVRVLTSAFAGAQNKTINIELAEPPAEVLPNPDSDNEEKNAAS